MQKNITYLSRLFKGEIPLIITFWVFAILVPLLFIGLSFFIIIAILPLFQAPLALIGTLSLLCVIHVLYVIFISIATWKSANRYSGRNIWSVLAKVGLVLGVLSILIILSQLAQALKGEPGNISAINQELPMMLNEQTRLDKISSENRHLFYFHTLVNMNRNEMDVNLFLREAAYHAQQVKCTSPDVKELLADGYDLFYIYRDQNNKLIGSIKITESDCEAPLKKD